MILSWFIGGPRDGEACSDILPVTVRRFRENIPNSCGVFPRRVVEVRLGPSVTIADYDNPASRVPLIARRGRYVLIAWDSMRQVAVYHYEGETSA